MSRAGRPSPALLRRAVILAGLLAGPLAATGVAAKTSGVPDDPSVQSGPCYDALVDKNAGNPTTAPNRELGAACQAEHGDVDKAWARVVRLWGSDSVDLPDYGSYRAADAPVDGSVPRWLAWCGVLLTYAVLGTPMRAAARLMGVVPGRGAGGRAVVDLIGGLILRAAILAGLAALAAIPYLGLLCGLLVVGLMVFDRPTTPRPAAQGDGRTPPTPLAEHLALVINDVAGAGLGLAALALFAQHGGLAMVVGVTLLAAVAAATPVLAGRRGLRSTRLGLVASRALLAAAIGEVLLLTPPLSQWLGGIAGASLAVPVVLAALAVAPAFMAGRPTISSAA